MMTLRQVMARLPSDGMARNKIRNFNLSPKAGGEVPSVKRLAQELGFEVELVDLPKGMSGRLVSDPFADNGYRIEINRWDNRLRQRFSVLHEIAHYFLHLDRSDPLASPIFRDSRNFYLEDQLHQEREANQFAAAIIFDEGALTAAVTLLGRDTAVLSKHFGFSTDVIEIGLARFK